MQEPAFSGAVEGPLDQTVFNRLVAHVGAVPGTVHVRNGKRALLDRLHGYNNAARRWPWLVLIDLDNDADCAPAFRRTHLPETSEFMCFRVAVRQIEAWLLGDRERLAGYLSVTASRFPVSPEALENPKRTLVGLARQSRRRATRELMVPTPTSGRKVGPGYTSELIGFVTDRENGWRPDVASRASPSLARCIECLRLVVRRTA